MKLNKILMALALVFSANAMAHADDGMPLSCELAFTAKGGGAQVLLGRFQLKGTGAIKCFDSNGNASTIPVRVTMGAHPLALRVAAGYIKVAGVATGIGISANPAALLGRYLVVGGQAVVGLGAGAHSALHANKGSLSLNTSLEVLVGLGFNVGISSLKLEPMEEKVLN